MAALKTVVGCLQAADDELAWRCNRLASVAGPGRALVSAAASWLAGLEVLLMAALALTGRRRSAARMLAGVALVFVASEGLGLTWRRERPFARLERVVSLAPHSPGRSFPSRHVASSLAMAVVGRRAHPRLGGAMAGAACLLGLSRVAAGLHYPSDVLAGALLGAAVGRLVRG